MVDRDRGLIIERPDRRGPFQSHPAGSIDECEDFAFEVGS